MGFSYAKHVPHNTYLPYLQPLAVPWRRPILNKEKLLILENSIGDLPKPESLRATNLNGFRGRVGMAGVFKVDRVQQSLTHSLSVRNA